jgi:hypothetical protein
MDPATSVTTLPPIPKIETWAMAHFGKLWQIITSHHHP